MNAIFKKINFTIQKEVEAELVVVCNLFMYNIDYYQDNSLHKLYLLLNYYYYFFINNWIGLREVLGVLRLNYILNRNKN